MKTLLLIITTLLTSAAFANNYGSNHHNSDNNSYYDGLEILEEAADIPMERLRDLQCRRYPSHRDLCRVEKKRVHTAKNNIRNYDGNLRSVKKCIQDFIHDRDSRMNELSCHYRNRNGNRDLCRVERIARSEYANDLLPAINDLIRRSERPRRDDRCRNRRDCNRDNDRGRGRGRRGPR